MATPFDDPSTPFDGLIPFDGTIDIPPITAFCLDFDYLRGFKLDFDHVRAFDLEMANPAQCGKVGGPCP